MTDPIQTATGGEVPEWARRAAERIHEETAEPNNEYGSPEWYDAHNGIYHGEIAEIIAEEYRRAAPQAAPELEKVADCEACGYPGDELFPNTCQIDHPLIGHKDECPLCALRRVARPEAEAGEHFPAPHDETRRAAMEEALREIAEADPDAEWVDSWKHYARTLRVTARRALGMPPSLGLLPLPEAARAAAQGGKP